MGDRMRGEKRGFIGGKERREGKGVKMQKITLLFAIIHT